MSAKLRYVIPTKTEDRYEMFHVVRYTILPACTVIGKICRYLSLVNLGSPEPIVVIICVSTPSRIPTEL